MSPISSAGSCCPTVVHRPPFGFLSDPGNCGCSFVRSFIHQITLTSNSYWNVFLLKTSCYYNNYYNIIREIWLFFSFSFSSFSVYNCYHLHKHQHIYHLPSTIYHLPSTQTNCYRLHNYSDCQQLQRIISPLSFPNFLARKLRTKSNYGLAYKTFEITKTSKEWNQKSFWFFDLHCRFYSLLKSTNQFDCSAYRGLS